MIKCYYMANVNNCKQNKIIGMYKVINLCRHRYSKHKKKKKPSVSWVNKETKLAYTLAMQKRNAFWIIRKVFFPKVDMNKIEVIYLMPYRRN